MMKPLGIWGIVLVSVALLGGIGLVLAGCGLRGNVIDDSEQLVIGASLAILDTPNNPPQRRDPGLNPIILIPVPDDIDTCEELMAIRDSLFPPEPEF